MSKLIAFFQSKNITAHATVLAIIALAGVITLDPQVQNLMMLVFKTHTDVVVLVVSIAGVIFRYSKSSTPVSTVQQAAQIINSGVVTVLVPVSPVVPVVQPEIVVSQEKV